jgi:hypothetical protein
MRERGSSFKNPLPTIEKVNSDYYAGGNPPPDADQIDGTRPDAVAGGLGTGAIIGIVVGVLVVIAVVVIVLVMVMKKRKAAHGAIGEEHELSKLKNDADVLATSAPTALASVKRDNASPMDILKERSKK